jgi:hypothetical protein
MNLINASRAQHLDTRINASTTSTAIPSTTILVTSCVSPHWIAIGANPVINTATNFIMPANSTLEFTCNEGDKVAVAAHNATGHVGIAY